MRLVLAVLTIAVAVTRAGAAPSPPAELVYKTVGERTLKLHVDYPPGWAATDRRPVIVFFFGGGWTRGSVRAFAPQAAHLAKRGLVAIRADYRIKSKDGVTPDACVEDARSAVRWVRKNAAKLGIDPAKLITAGGSAGGHLAACAAIGTCVEAKGDDLTVSTVPAAMVLFNPVLDFTPEMLSRRLGGDMDLARRISPTLHLHAKTPPSLLLYGSRDVLIAQGDAYAEKAKSLGVRVERFVAVGQGHSFFNRPPWRDVTTREMDRFLESLGLLKPPARPKDRLRTEKK
jgi:acetyl esterase/lipase